MDEGTDAMDILSGKVIQLKHDFIGVVNRGQRDIESNKPITQALDKEKEFFDNHPAYRSVAHKMGIPYLAKKLNSILLSHIRRTLPEIRAKISNLIQKGQQRLAEYGTPLAETNMDNGALLLQLLTEYSREYSDTIDGKHTNLTDKGSLFGGALINHIFTDKFTPLINGIDACENLTDTEIKTAIRNANGTRNSLFVPEESFELLVRRQVKKLEDPSLRCCDQVYKELLNLLEVSDRGLARFPNLKEKVKEFCCGLLQRYLKPLKHFIKDIIRIELAYVNTNHPDFFSGGQTSHVMLQSLENNMQQQQQPPQQQPGSGIQGGQPPAPHQRGGYQESSYDYNYQPSTNSMGSKEDRDSRIIKELLTSYFNIVRKNIADKVPKAIMHFLVNMSKLHLQSELVGAVYKPDLFEDLLYENEEIAQKRKAAQKMLDVLLRAQE
eukprot:CAMPEP_0117432838 /NCGR_PEP_ID=MMETSP0758-20121206/12265_1 /TAXON_ID=63605 /ORGANISM="Percolomonas cosmopolitus, Strain AE-1 (ATCC 50343)" /LENGTH=437 /DNA_ID=CAMNT_0005223033 /DNA_START=119 /DNA_END=1429 /DNA_ORIENTATION=+